MIDFEQVKLLETKVAGAIEYIELLTGENSALHQKETEMQKNLETYQKRIDELEVLVMRFREDQSRVEDVILAALSRLNQFEEAVDKSMRDKPGGGSKAAAKEKAKPEKAGAPAIPPASSEEDGSGDGKICFEIPSAEKWQGGESGIEIDIPDPLDDESFAGAENPPEKNGELDIF